MLSSNQSQGVAAGVVAAEEDRWRRVLGAEEAEEPSTQGSADSHVWAKFHQKIPLLNVVGCYFSTLFRSILFRNARH